MKTGIFKKVASAFLAGVMTFTSLTLPASAEPARQGENLQYDYQIVEDNSFAKMLSSAMSEEANVDDEQFSCFVNNVIVSGNSAAVEYSVTDDCTIIVSLYDEQGYEMLATASAQASKDENTLTINFNEGDVPEYFYVKAYAVDDNMRPLSKEYATNTYTQAFIEMMSKTVDDFAADRVLNLDESTDNNFMVYKDEIISIPYTEGVNVVTSADFDNSVFVFDNINEAISALEPGDMFSYIYGEGNIIISKITSIEISGTTATICGEELAFEEAFDFIKIDGASNSDDIVVNEETASDNVEYMGMMDEDELEEFKQSFYTDESGLQVVDGSKDAIDIPTLTDRKVLTHKLSSITGLSVGVTLDIGTNFSFYYDFRWGKSDVWKLGLDFTYDMSLFGSLEKDFIDATHDFPEVVIAAAAYVKVAATPYICFGKLTGAFKGEIGFKGTSVGFKVESGDNGKPVFLNTSTKGKMEWDVGLEFTLSFSIGCKIHCDLIDDLILGVGMDFKYELSLSAYYSLKDVIADNFGDEKAVIHDCLTVAPYTCMKLVAKISGKSSTYVESVKKVVAQTELETILPLHEQTYYWSLTYNSFNHDKCPYMSYKTDIAVMDSKAHRITDATVYFGASDTTGVKVDGDGFANGYLRENTNTIITVKADGYVTHTDVYKIDEPSSFKVVLYGENESVTGDSTGAAPDDIFSGVEDITPDAGDDPENSVPIDPNDVLIPVIVKDELGYIVSGAMVTCSFDIFTTDENGMVTVPGITGETLVVTVSADGYYTIEKKVLVTEDTSEVEVVIKLITNSPDDFEYTIENGEVTITDYVGESTSVVIPLTIEGSPVTDITFGINYYNNKITKIIIPSSVNSIQYLGLSGCSKLTNIIVDPKNIAYSSVDGVLFSKDMTDIYVYPTGKNETSYKIPDTVTSLSGSVTFMCSALTSITIPDSITRISSNVFSNCSGLTNIFVDSSNENFTSINGILFTKNMETIIAYPQNRTESSYTIPDGVIEIDDGAFCNCDNLTNIIIPEGVTSIGESAFWACRGLTSIYIPEGATIIREHTFTNCGNLVDITIPESVTYIAISAFSSCSNLTNLYVSTNNTAYTIVDGVLFTKDMKILHTYPNGKTETDYIVPEGAISIYANFSNNLERVTIPSSVTYIDWCSFLGCFGVTDVYYTGTEEQWKNIANYGYVTYWTNSATIHYNSTALETVDVSYNSTETMKAESVEISYLSNTETAETIDVSRAVFSGLVPEKLYNFYVMVDKNAENPFSSANLLNIQQGTADSMGVLTITYIGDERFDNADIFVVGTPVSIENATVESQSFMYTGKTHYVDPVVTLNGKVLDSAKDYYLSGAYRATETGDYTYRIIGQGEYSGTIEVAYRINSQNGDCSFTDGVTPSYSYTVVSDVDEITATITYSEAVDDGATFGFNDWCANGVIVTTPDGVKHYYQWGGSQVTWGWDADADGNFECGGGINGDTWLGTVSDLTAMLTIPVEKGATVDFITLGWESYSGVQYSVEISEEDMIASFVERLYTTMLGRSSDPTGKANHVSSLNNGKTAAEVSAKFVTSTELKNLKLTNDEFVLRMYQTFMNRTPSAKEITRWATTLENGCTYEYVLKKFVASAEFKKLCAEYGITAGTYTPAGNRDYDENITAFVSRMYTTLLGRSYDATGLNNNTGIIINGGTAADVGKKFVMSGELTNLKLSNDEFVKRMYQTFLNRTPSAKEITRWATTLENGCSYGYILKKFVASTEFNKLCTKYGISAGEYATTENRDYNENITAYVSRMYTKALGRKYDIKGLNNNTGRLITGEMTAAEVAEYFILSKEFVNRKLTDEQYVTVLYSALFDRAPDAGGKKKWLGKLAGGTSREEVLKGFTTAAEFEKLVESFGL